MDAALVKTLRELIDRQEMGDALLPFGRDKDRFDRALVRSRYFDDAIDERSNFGAVPDMRLDLALEAACSANFDPS